LNLICLDDIITYRHSILHLDAAHDSEAYRGSRAGIRELACNKV